MKLVVLLAALCTSSCTAITLAPERPKPQLQRANKVLAFRGGLSDKNQAIQDILKPSIDAQAEKQARSIQEYEKSSPLVGVITLDDAKYCHDDIHSEDSKQWALGDSDNRNSYWSLGYRCLFHRVEGLTFGVVKAGLSDDNIFNTPGVIITHRVATDMEPMLNYTDEYIESHSKLTGNKSTQRKRTVLPSITDRETSYTYSSNMILEGLKRAVYALLERNVSVIVGDCGFDNGIQTIITKIIADARPHKRCPCLMSPLTMLPTILKMIAEKEVVLVLTSNSISFNEHGFKKLTGLDDTFGDILNSKQTVSVLGLQDVEGFGNPVASGDSVDLTLSQRQIPEIISARMKNLTAEGKAVGAILSECSELPAYSNKFREKFGVPVFDAMTAVSFVADSLKPNLAYNASAVADDGKPFKRETPSELAERMGWKEEPKEEL
uniref:Uncharacterized protein n=1 Tax=Phaeocystis antarctica TaxID=33657 RepID=A0A7S0F578_9EUKA